MARGRDGGLELVWPGKYDDDGNRTAVPRRGGTLSTSGLLPGGGGAVPLSEAEQSPLFAAARPASERAEGDAPDRLIVADNLLALDALATAQPGSVDLIVADPPFSTGGRYDVVTRVGEGPSPQEIRAPAYTDAWEGGPAGLVAMLDPRLRLCHELLAPHGSLYVHVDPTVGHAVKLLLDEVFGPGCFQREIVWRIGWVSGFKTKARNWIRNHDLIFFYVKDPKRFVFNKHYVPYPEGYKRRDGAAPKGKGVPVDDVWNANEVEHALRGPDSLDSIQIKSFSHEKTGYATQKNESLLRRIVEASSNEGDVVLDPFCGSGTTLAVARALGRRCIGIDTSRAAIQISLRRLATAPGPAIAVQHLQALERAALVEDGHDWDAYLGVQDGAHEGRRVVHIDEARSATEADLRGRKATEVVAWSWRLDVPVEHDDEVARTTVPPAFGGKVVAMSIGRDVSSPHPRSREGLLPLACPQLALTRVRAGLLRVELLGVAEGWPKLRPATELPTSGLDLVDGWALDTSADDPPAFSFAAWRRHHRRALVSSVEIPWPSTPIRVRTWDVLHRCVDLEVVLEAQGETVAVRSAVLQVGDV